MHPQELATFIDNKIRLKVANASTVTRYREPLMRWVKADNNHFEELHTRVHPDLLLPDDMLHGAKSVVVFFLPFENDIPLANSRDKDKVASEWARAYIETNSLLKHITDTLIDELAGLGIRAAADPPTHNFDPVTLRSSWSHKSVAVIAGLGSFGLHQMVITDAGCAGRFSSFVIDADLPELVSVSKERCLYFANGTCTLCVKRCPSGALQVDESLNKQLCWQRCLTNAESFEQLGVADVCGKCTTGPCALQDPVQS